jgi:O-antigen ligase
MQEDLEGPLTSSKSEEPVPSIVDFAFAMVLFLVMTDLYRFIALWAGFSNFALVAGVFTLAAVGYSLVYWRYTCIPLGRFIAWTTFIVLIPLGSLAYSLNPNFRDIALQVLYLALLWGSKAFFSRSTTKSLRGVLLDAGLFVGFTGVVLSIIKPRLFIAISEMTGDETPYFQGRGYGFYLQPNVCAATLTLLFFLWLFVRKPSRFIHIIFTFGYLLAIFLTGSRGGMVMSVFLVSFHMLLASPGWSLSRLSARLIRLGLFGGVGLLLVIGAVFTFAPRLTPDGAVETLNRIGSLAKYRELTQGDASIGGRLDAQQAYLSLIVERPLLGYGIGSAPVMRERRLLVRGAHNTFIEYAFAYGAIGLIAWLSVSIITWQDCLALRWSLQHKIDLLFFGVVFIACMVSSTVLGNRVLYIVLGWLLAQRYTYTYHDELNASSEVECVECHDHAQQGGGGSPTEPCVMPTMS